MAVKSQAECAIGSCAGAEVASRYTQQCASPLGYLFIVLQASRQGIYVSNIPSADTGNAVSCAEHAILLTLSLLRQMPACAASIREKRLGHPMGLELIGRNVLIIGCGGIGRALIPRLSAFGVHLRVVRRSMWGTDNQVRH
jgi:phosphoglycerate dehydrogenase-like enzyme